MISLYLKQINWVDVFIIIVLIRICYISLKNGFPIEIFKLLGTIFAIFLACHYYVRMSNFLNNYLLLSSKTVIQFLSFLSFFLLFSLGCGIFLLIRMLFTLLIKMEAISLLNRWGAFMLGICRWALLISVIFFSIAISNMTYFKNSLSKSLTGLAFLRVTPKVYLALWDGVMFRFMSNKALNKSVFQVEQNLVE